MRRTRRQSARLALLGLVSLLAVAGIVGLTVHHDAAPGGVPVVPTPPHDSGGAEVPDPFAWTPAREPELVRRAAAGSAHVLFERSPDGVMASAARTARYRPLIDAAARQAGVNADTLEGLVLLESAGRPDAIAPDGIEGAVGLTQILAQTGRDLLGMHIDTQASARLTRRISRLRERGRETRADALVRERAHVDQRFDPRAELEATARYLALARKRFGREDLAFVSYHMGIGNLQDVLRLYGDEHASYARLYFDSTPANHPEAWHRLYTFGDDSSNYLWKVLAARDVMHLWRTGRARLQRLQDLQTAKGSAEEVLHPPDSTPRFATPDQLRAAWDDGSIVAFPDRPGQTGLKRDASMGQLASRLGQRPELYHGLRPEALALALYLGAQVRSLSGTGPLVVTSTVRDEDYQRILGEGDAEATRGYSLHTTGWAFDIDRGYRSGRQALAFQFMLDRLQALNLIAWVREPHAIHITVGSDAKLLLPLLNRAEKP